MASDIVFLTAREMARMLRARQISARELLEAHLAQIERVNPKVNAIVTLVAEQARAAAARADERQARGEPLGPLHGLPIAHKDLQDTAGIRTTHGSPLYRDHVPAVDTLTVARLKQAGAITLGKTNTPEFGAGSQTYNEVFGATLNPYDMTKTCGGSSGGAGVALACGMLPIADGSDSGGSLRNPANYCNVVGLRPSLGRVPVYPRQNIWGTLSVDGPMARTAGDVALVLAALAGPDPRAPLSLSEPGSRFLAPLERDFNGTRIAWSRDLGGLPVDPRVTAALEAQRATFAALGCVIEDGEPDFAGADMSFKTLRAYNFYMGHAEEVRLHRDQIKETVIWNTEQGAKLTAPELCEAEVARTRLYHRVREYMETHEFLVLPVSQVPPFDVTTPYVTEINGVQMTTYIDWMKSCYYISALGLPAASVPCGFTPEGLPVGVQIVGRANDDFGVLQLAHAFETATQFWRRRPAVVA